MRSLRQFVQKIAAEERIPNRQVFPEKPEYWNRMCDFDGCKRTAFLHRKFCADHEIAAMLPTMKKMPK